MIAATTAIIPIVFGKLSVNAIAICRSMVIMMSFFMPAWVLINAQQAVARAGGDTKMGAYADASITIVIMLPMLFALAKFTNIGPVQMYLSVKLLDVIKITIFHFWLKKERWLNNLTEIGNEQDSVNANDEVVESGIAVKSV